MKKMVMACMCDLCGKQVEEKSSRYAVRLGIGNWNDDVVQQTNEKDLCRECYDVIRDLLKYESAKKPKLNEVAYGYEPDSIDNGITSRRSKYDMKKLEQMFCDGYPNRRIEKELGMQKGSASYYIRKLESKGLTRGQNKMPEINESPVRMKTVMDSSTGLIMSVNRE